MLIVDSPVIVEFKRFTPNIPIDIIVKSLKANNDNIDKYFEDEIFNCLHNSQDKIKPYGCYIIKKISKLDISKGIIFINDKVLNVNNIISKQLKGSEYLVIFICTIGDEIESLSRNKIKDGDFLNGLIYNNIGSEAVEKVADYIQNQIQIIADSNKYKITNRFSPGYCKWNVDEQKILFSFFPSSINIVQLNKSSLMYPIKSVSGIIGIGKEVQKKAYYCHQCNEKNCIYLYQNKYEKF